MLAEANLLEFEQKLLEISKKCLFQANLVKLSAAIRSPTSYPGKGEPWHHLCCRNYS